LKRASLIVVATSPGGKTAGLATLRGSRVNAAELIIVATSPGGKTAGLATLRGKPRERGCVDYWRNVARR
jgi:hypothetical protein